MTTDELRNYFKTYLDQIPILVKVNADWALLHYIIIFPDICGALENPDGQSSPANYISWADRYVADTILSGEEWYDIRCRILHQGITAGRKRYTRYSFKSPGNTAVTHKAIQQDKSIILDVHAMKDELLSGLNKWFFDVEKTQQSNMQNVPQNVSSLATIVTVSGGRYTSVTSIQQNIHLSGTVSPISPKSI